MLFFVLLPRKPYFEQNKPFYYSFAVYFINVFIINYRSMSKVYSNEVWSKSCIISTTWQHFKFNLCSAEFHALLQFNIWVPNIWQLLHLWNTAIIVHEYWHKIILHRPIKVYIFWKNVSYATIQITLLVHCCHSNYESCYLSLSCHGNFIFIQNLSIF